MKMRGCAGVGRAQSPPAPSVGAGCRCESLERINKMRSRAGVSHGGSSEEASLSGPVGRAKSPPSPSVDACVWGQGLRGNRQDEGLCGVGRAQSPPAPSIDASSPPEGNVWSGNRRGSAGWWWGCTNGRCTVQACSSTNLCSASRSKRSSERWRRVMC